MAVISVASVVDLKKWKTIFRDMKDIKNIKLVSKNTIYAQVYKLKEVIDGDSIQNQYLGKY